MIQQFLFEISFILFCSVALAKQEVAFQERIAKGLAGLLRIPPKGDIKLMKGQQGLYRLRIGTYRILFEINHTEKIVYIQTIDSRGGIYK